MFGWLEIQVILGQLDTFVDFGQLERKNVQPTFEVYEGDTKNLIGYQCIKCHMIWDIKLGENFDRTGLKSPCITA